MEKSLPFPTPPVPRSVWIELKKAISGEDLDYTQIGLRRAIFLLAVPMILELVMESIFAVVDIYYVGKLGPSAVATVGLTETYLYLLYSIAIGLTTGVTAIVARRIGEKKPEDAGKAAIQSIFLGMMASVPFFIGGVFYSRELLEMMGGDPWALRHGYQYTQWMLGGNAVITLLFVLNGVFRGAGDATISFVVLFVANGLNLLLDPLLIFGWGPVPAMGIEGAAIATNIGRGTGVLLQLAVLFGGGRRVNVSLKKIAWHGTTIWQIFKTSLGGIGQMIVAMTSWIFLMRILSDVGSDAVAGATIALRIFMFTLMPAWGLSNAAGTLVGQNLGANQPQRAEDSVWKIGFYNMLFLIAVAFVYFFANQWIMGIFTADENVIAIGGEWLRILSYGYFVYGWWMVSTQAFNGAGDTKTPTYINLVFFWFFQIPLAYLLALHLHWGHTGVFWTVFISETSVGLFTLWRFKVGNWKTHKV